MSSLFKSQSVLVFGTGSGARHFVQQYRESCDLVGAVDSQAAQDDFMGLPLFCESDEPLPAFDVLVVASWAIKQISQRLIAKGIPCEKIYWYQNHRDTLLPLSQIEEQSYTQTLNEQDILVAIYDLNCARTTFDISGFLVLADIERERRQLQHIHLVIVNADDNEFNRQMAGIITTNEHLWRKNQVLSQCAWLLESVSGVTLTSRRQELLSYLEMPHCFPDDYCIDAPQAQWEFNHIFAKARSGQSILRLKAPDVAKKIAGDYLERLKLGTRKLVVITLRVSKVQPKRNSDIDAWQRFARELESDKYLVVVIPDFDDPWPCDWQADNIHVFPEACFNTALRMGIYEAADLNMGVNNGPMHLCAFGSECRYVMIKQVVNDYPHSSLESFEHRGFDIGGNFPGSGPGQYFVWEDDSLDVLRKAFATSINEK